MADEEGEWIEQADEEGNIYYVHTVTGESSWEKPGAVEEGEWIEQDDGEGNVYYMHTGTYETRWDRPPEMDGGQDPAKKTIEKGGEEAVASEKVQDASSGETQEQLLEESIPATEEKRDETSVAEQEVKEVSPSEEMPQEEVPSKEEIEALPDESAEVQAQEEYDKTRGEEVPEDAPEQPPAEERPTSPWMLVHDDEGNPYYFNQITHECAWEKPSDYDESAEEFTDVTPEMREKMKNALKRQKVDKETQEKIDEAKKKQDEATRARDEAINDGAEHWVEVYDPESDAFYYYGSYTHEITWDQPDNYVMAADDEMMSAVIKIQCAFRARMARRKVYTEVNARVQRWVEYTDEDSGALMYYNTETGEISEVMPDDFRPGATPNDDILEKMKKTLEGKAKIVSKEITEKVEKAKKEAEEKAATATIKWVSVYDPNSESFYYYDPDSGDTTWDQPEDFVESADDETMTAVIKIQCAFRTKLAKKKIEEQRTALLKKAMKRVDKEVQDKVEKAQREAEELAAVNTWVAVYDPNSEAFYYYNTETSETCWDKPENFVEGADDETMTAVIKIQCMYRTKLARQKFERKKTELLQKKESEKPEDGFDDAMADQIVEDEAETKEQDDAQTDANFEEGQEILKKALAKPVDKELVEKVEKAKQQAEELAAASAVNWIAVFDPNSQAFYYYDPASGETTWDKPENYVEGADDETITAVIKIQCAFRSKLARRKIEKKRSQLVITSDLAEEKAIVEEKIKERRATSDEAKLGASKADAQAKALDESKKRMNALNEKEEEMKRELAEVRKRKEEKKRLAREQRLKEEKEAKRKAEEEEKRLRREQREAEKAQREKERLERLEKKREAKEAKRRAKQQAFDEAERNKRRNEELLQKKKEEQRRLRILEREKRDKEREERRKREQQEFQENCAKWSQLYVEEVYKVEQEIMELHEWEEQMNDLRARQYAQKLGTSSKTSGLAYNPNTVTYWDAVHAKVPLSCLEELVNKSMQNGSTAPERFALRKEQLKRSAARLDHELPLVKEKIDRTTAKLQELNDSEAKFRSKQQHAKADDCQQQAADTQEAIKRMTKQYSECEARAEYLTKLIDEPLEGCPQMEPAEIQLSITSWHNDEGDTLLHRSAWQGCVEKVKYLLSLAVNINMIDSTVNKCTALHEAVRGGHIEVTKLLLSAGARLNLQDISGDTPLHLACRKSNRRLIQVLVEADWEKLETYNMRNHKNKKPKDLVQRESAKRLVEVYEKENDRRQLEAQKEREKEDLKNKVYRKKQKKNMLNLRRHIRSINSLAANNQL